MEKKFTSDEVPLGQLLDEAEKGKLQLPDFQRGWIWDDERITSLLASISLSYPIGAVMTLETGNPAVRFQPRVLQGVELAEPIEPEVLMLDGQQRSTSLFLALKSGKPVPTQDAQKKRTHRRYYAAIRDCLDPSFDREDAIVSIPADGKVKNFRGEVLLDVSTRDAELAAERFPLSIVLDYAATMKWQLAYLSDGPGDPEDRLSTWTAFNEGVITPFVQYQVPTIRLIRETPKVAVCQVFEKVNTGGVALNVFELLTATFAADNFSLRDDWEARDRALEQHAILGDFDETRFLQLVSLLTTYARRAAHLAAHPGDDKAPAVSCKRREILSLELADYKQWADVAMGALERVVPFLHGQHVFDAKDVPYPTQIVPLAAILAVLGQEAEGMGAQQQIAQWFWCGVLGEMYGGSTETRFALDLPDVVDWVRSDEGEPRTVRDAQFQAERLLTLRTRNSAAYKGLYALQMKRGARDMRTGNTIDIHAYVDDAIDIHHIFPRHWCAVNGIDEGMANCIVNKTPIDSHTNGRIGGHAPSKYLASLQAGAKVEPEAMDEILHSHDIDPLALRSDDFPAFFNSRFERLLRLVAAAMRKSVNRSPDQDESPFADPEEESKGLQQRIETLIDRGESKVLEFKATGRKNLHTGERDQKIEFAVLKSLAGFANGYGGTLLVGVNDDGSMRGVEDDLPLLHKSDFDGWALWLTDAVSSALGAATAAELNLRFCEIAGRTVAAIDIGPATTPVFASDGKGSASDVFFVRAGHSTRELTGQEALNYQKSRWR